MPRIISDELFQKFVEYGDVESYDESPFGETNNYWFINGLLKELRENSRPLRVAMFGSSSGYMEDDDA